MDGMTNMDGDEFGRYGNGWGIWSVLFFLKWGGGRFRNLRALYTLPKKGKANFMVIYKIEIVEI